MYSIICKAIEIDTLTQRRLTDLLAELNQLGIIEGTNVYQGRYGRKKIITNITSKEQTLETLYHDYHLKTIEEIPQSNFYKGLSFPVVIYISDFLRKTAFIDKNAYFISYRYLILIYPCHSYSTNYIYNLLIKVIKITLLTRKIVFLVP